MSFTRYYEGDPLNGVEGSRVGGLGLVDVPHDMMMLQAAVGTAKNHLMC
jgi:hypothetical protein